MRSVLVSVVFLLTASAACSPASRSSDVDESSLGIRVWSGDGPDFQTGDISPDGRYLTDVDWNGGELDLVDIETGERRRLTSKGTGGSGYAWTSAFSTDGQRLAMAWYVNREDSYELRVMNRDGADSRVLIPAGADHLFVDPLDWSPTDEEILVGAYDRSQHWQLVLVSVRDGGRRMVKEFGFGAPGGAHEQGYPHAQLSPDGKFVAYDYAPAGGGPAHDIFAVDVSTGATTELVSGSGSDRFLGWLPDGSGILFYSDREGAPGVWRAPVQNGRATGAPTLVRAGLYGLVPLGFTNKGYAYGVPTERERIHTAVIDPVSGTIGLRPEGVADPVWRGSLAGDWSPDGTRLAYVTLDPLPDPEEALQILTETGEVARRIPLTPAVHSNNGTLRWVSEDRVLIYGVAQGREGVYAIDLRSGAIARLATPESIAVKWFEAGPEGRTLYVVANSKPGRRDNELLAYDVASETHHVIGTARVIANTLAVSADGSELAFVARTDAGRLELRTMSTRSGAMRVLEGVPEGQIGSPVAWMPDGAHIIVAAADGTGASALWSVGVEGGEPLRVLADCCRERDVRIDRGGRRFAFVAGSDRGEVWILPY